MAPKKLRGALNLFSLVPEEHPVRVKCPFSFDKMVTSGDCFGGKTSKIQSLANGLIRTQGMVLGQH